MISKTYLRYIWLLDTISASNIHKSQSEVASRYGEFAEFTYRVCLTPELMSKILAMGSNVEVLEPAEYREEVMSQIRASLDRYMNKE